VPTGGFFEFNESFLKDTDDNIDGYVTTEPLAIQSMRLKHINDPAYDFRRLKWENRLPEKWDEMNNIDDNVYPEDDDNINRLGLTDYLYLPFGDDCNINLFDSGCAEVDPNGERQTFLAESCPEGFFEGLSEDNRTAVRMLTA